MPDAMISGVLVRNVKVMESKFPGFCVHTRRRFPAGTMIAYKGANYFTPAERTALFPDGNVTAIAAVWDEVNAANPGIRQNNVPADHKPSLHGKAPENRYGDVPVRSGKPMFTPSSWQMNVLNTFLGGMGNILIKALAGSGKTSTLVWLIWTLHEMGLLRGKRCLALAFNKNIQRELYPKLKGTNCPALTTHAFCMRLMGITPEMIVKGRDRNILQRVICDKLGLEINRDTLAVAKKSAYWELRQPILELIGYVKAWAILPSWDGSGWKWSIDQIHEIESICDKYKLKVAPDAKQMVVDFAAAVISNSYPAPGDKIIEATFDDMLYLPLLMKISMPRYDIIVNDECQDYNRCQINILAALERAGARIICVGDENQAMYLFRGADARAFQRCESMLRESSKGFTTCDLPVNYRSDRAIIEHARELVPALQGFKQGAGLVGELMFAQAIEEAQNNYDGGESWAFLCRINTPLVITAYQLVAKRKRVCILGRNAVAGPLWNLIDEVCRDSDDPMFTDRVSDLRNESGDVIREGLLTRLAIHYKVETAKWGEDEKYATQLENLRNNIECIEIISAQVSDDRVQSVKDEIDALFSDAPEPGVIVLSTIHGAKGLEWDNVVCIRPDLIPFPSVVMYDLEGNITDEYQQELNIDYVMRTRGKKRLYRLGNWPFGRQARREIVGEMTRTSMGKPVVNLAPVPVVAEAEMEPSRLASPHNPEPYKVESAAAVLVDDGKPF